MKTAIEGVEKAIAGGYAGIEGEIRALKNGYAGIEGEVREIPFPNFGITPADGEFLTKSVEAGSRIEGMIYDGTYYYCIAGLSLYRASSLGGNFVKIKDFSGEGTDYYSLKSLCFNGNYYALIKSYNFSYNESYFDTSTIYYTTEPAGQWLSAKSNIIVNRMFADGDGFSYSYYGDRDEYGEGIDPAVGHFIPGVSESLTANINSIPDGGNLYKENGYYFIQNIYGLHYKAGELLNGGFTTKYGFHLSKHGMAFFDGIYGMACKSDNRYKPVIYHASTPGGNWTEKILDDSIDLTYRGTMSIGNNGKCWLVSAFDYTDSYLYYAENMGGPWGKITFSGKKAPVLYCDRKSIVMGFSDGTIQYLTKG